MSAIFVHVTFGSRKTYRGTGNGTGESRADKAGRASPDRMKVNSNRRSSNRWVAETN
jgi:hypothetical protein